MRNVTDILSQLKADEGFSGVQYKDSLGNPTIGYGHEVKAGEVFAQPMSEEDAEALLQVDVDKATKALLLALPWANELSPARQGVLINMTFNMGLARVLGFHKTLALVEAGGYEGAADEMANSTWSAEVPNRAHRLELQMRYDKWY